MLHEAQSRKMEDFQKQRSNELEFVNKLRSDLEMEKKQSLDKRMKEMKEAQQIIKDNEKLKLKQDEEKKKDKE